MVRPPCPENTLEKVSKSIEWKAVAAEQSHGPEYSAGSSDHDIYIVWDTPVQTVEDQANKITPNRLDFSIVGIAAGASDKVGACDEIVGKVRAMTGNGYGGMSEDPRWEFYARTDKDVDCHHRAALAASAFGVVGIKGYVHRVYATCHPVPNAPTGLNANSTTNDYVGNYDSGSRMKYREESGDTHKLKFQGNNFEGCVRVEDASADDGNAWWTVWPRKQHKTAKDLLIWYDGDYPQRWETLTYNFIEDESVPKNELADKPKILGGPN